MLYSHTCTYEGARLLARKEEHTGAIPEVGLNIWVFSNIGRPPPPTYSITVQSMLCPEGTPSCWKPMFSLTASDLGFSVSGLSRGGRTALLEVALGLPRSS